MHFMSIGFRGYVSWPKVCFIKKSWPTVWQGEVMCELKSVSKCFAERDVIFFLKFRIKLWQIEILDLIFSYPKFWKYIFIFFVHYSNSLKKIRENRQRLILHAQVSPGSRQETETCLLKTNALKRSTVERSSSQQTVCASSSSPLTSLSSLILKTYNTTNGTK